MGLPVIWIPALGGGLCCCGLVTLLWQWWAARHFDFEQRQTSAAPLPGVTVIKPLRGADDLTRAALETWLQLDYPGPVEVLFVLESDDGAAAAMVEELLAAHESMRGSAASRKTGRSSEVVAPYPRYVRVIRCTELSGANAKIAKVIQAAAEAVYDVFVMSDADVAAPAELLREAVRPVGNPDVGLCCCLYRLAGAGTPAARWEAAAVNIDFWSQVLQARTLGAMDFGLGAVMVLSREWVGRIGGFESVADYLADDYQLGRRIHAAGGRIELCPVVVDCREPERGWGSIWRHQLRWARTIRVSRPLAYGASILSNALLGPIVWLAATGCACGLGRVNAGWLSLTGSLALLAMVSVRVLMALDLQRRFVPRRQWWVPWWMPPVKDLLALGLWVAAFTGNRVEWRGLQYRVSRDGRLTLLRSEPLDPTSGSN